MLVAGAPALLACLLLEVLPSSRTCGRSSRWESREPSSSGPSRSRREIKRATFGRRRRAGNVEDNNAEQAPSEGGRAKASVDVRLTHGAEQSGRGGEEEEEGDGYGSDVSERRSSRSPRRTRRKSQGQAHTQEVASSTLTARKRQAEAGRQATSSRSSSRSEALTPAARERDDGRCWLLRQDHKPEPGIPVRTQACARWG